MPRGRSRTPLAGRFWPKVERTDGCWFWRGSRRDNGYGVIARNGYDTPIRWVLAHRASWEINVGPISDGLCVCHHCDNRACVRPDHLFLGTIAENNADMQTKGRGSGGKKKITRDQVFEILDMLGDGLTQQNVASIYGVTQTAVSLIRRGLNWSRVSGIAAQKPGARRRPKEVEIWTDCYPC